MAHLITRGGWFQEPTLVIHARVSLAYASPVIKACKLDTIEGVMVEDWLSDQSISAEGALHLKNGR